MTPEQIQSLLTEASAESVKSSVNQTICVDIPTGRYTLTSGLTAYGNISIRHGNGKGMNPVEYVYDGPDNITVFDLGPGHGREIGNFAIRVPKVKKNLTLFRSREGKNCHYEAIRLYAPDGVDCRGFVCQDWESTTINRIDSCASQPFSVLTGDNHCWSNVDLKAATTAESLAKMNLNLISVPMILGMPKGWTMAGQNALHGGRQAIFCETKSADATGNFLEIAGGVRYEQPSPDSSRPLIEFNIVNRALEAFRVSGFIRSSQRTGPAFGWATGKIWRTSGIENFFELGK